MPSRRLPPSFGGRFAGAATPVLVTVVMRQPRFARRAVSTARTFE